MALKEKFVMKPFDLNTSECLQSIDIAMLISCKNSFETHMNLVPLSQKHFCGGTFFITLHNLQSTTLIAKTFASRRPQLRKVIFRLSGWYQLLRKVAFQSRGRFPQLRKVTFQLLGRFRPLRKVAFQLLGRFLPLRKGSTSHFAHPRSSLRANRSNPCHVPARFTRTCRPTMTAAKCSATGTASIITRKAFAINIKRERKSFLNILFTI